MSTRTEEPRRGKMTVAEVGRKSDQKTADTCGQEFCEEIGHNSGSNRKKVVNPQLNFF